MIKTSQAFREAIVGSPRRIELLAVVDISVRPYHLRPGQTHAAPRGVFGGGVEQKGGAE